MSSNAWITAGIICLAIWIVIFQYDFQLKSSSILIILKTAGIICMVFSSFAIPYGFYLKSTSIQIDSLKESKSLTHEDELAYKGIVTQILNELQPHSNVHINDVIKGFNSKKNQKVDISVRSKIEGQEVLTIIKTYAGSEPIDISELKEFYSTLNDVRASKGFIISNAGFTSPVEHIAPSYGIEIYSIIDAQSAKWNDDIKIPVLYIKLKVNFILQGGVYLDGVGDSLPDNPALWIISFDGGKTSQPLIEFFILMWNKNKISRVAELNHTLDIDKDNFFLLVRQNKWVKAENLLLSYKIEQEGFLHYFEPEEYRALKNHISGNIEPSSLLMKFKFLKDDEKAVKIDDIDNFKNRTKGILITLENRLDKLSQVTGAEATFKLIDKNKQ